MIKDVVLWNSAVGVCNRCGAKAKQFIPPYYAPDKRICPQCVVELNRLFDEQGWPQEGRLDQNGDNS